MDSNKFVVAVERSNGGPYEAVETSEWTGREAPVFTAAIPIVAAEDFRQMVLAAPEASGIHEAKVDEWTYRFLYEVAE